MNSSCKLALCQEVLVLPARRRHRGHDPHGVRRGLVGHTGAPDPLLLGYVLVAELILFVILLARAIYSLPGARKPIL